MVCKNNRGVCTCFFGSNVGAGSTLTYRNISHSVPKHKQLLYIYIQSKHFLYLGTDLYLFFGYFRLSYVVLRRKTVAKRRLVGIVSASALHTPSMQLPVACQHAPPPPRPSVINTPFMQLPEACFHAPPLPPFIISSATRPTYVMRVWVVVFFFCATKRQLPMQHLREMANHRGETNTSYNI